MWEDVAGNPCGHGSLPSGSILPSPCLLPVRFASCFCIVGFVPRGPQPCRVLASTTGCFSASSSLPGPPLCFLFGELKPKASCMQLSMQCRAPAPLCSGQQLPSSVTCQGCDLLCDLHALSRPCLLETLAEMGLVSVFQGGCGGLGSTRRGNPSLVSVLSNAAAGCCV